MSVACRAFLGIDSENDEAGRVISREFNVLLDWLAEHLRNPVAAPAWAPTRRNRAMRTARAELHAAVADVIARRRCGGDDREDVVGRLLRSQQEQPETITDVDIIEECVGFLFAGHETTASTLTWALYELARNPDLQSEVAAEGRSLRLDADDLHDQAGHMAVTEAVVDETLRLYPSGISIVRQARRTTQIGEQRIRRGTVVMIPVYRIQRQETAWAHPHDFDHTRFIDGGSPARRDAYLPFGLGPRRCLGARFARTEMRLALAMICERWHLAYQPSSPPQPEVNPAFRIAGQLPLRLDRRAAPEST
jgi:cytochrome P450